MKSKKQRLINFLIGTQQSRNKKIRTMSTDTHLTNEEIAQCAEAINEGKYNSLHSSLRDHLSSCDYCASEVMIVSEVTEELEEESVELKKKAKDLRIKPWQISAISIAAAAAVLFFIVTIMDRGLDISESEITQEIETIPEVVYDEKDDTIYLKEHPKPSIDVLITAENQEKVITEDSIIEYKSPELLAVYLPDENLEQLYENMKGVYRSRDITINTPHTIFYEAKDSLSWDNPDKKTVHIEFFNNSGEEIKTIITDNNLIAIPEFPPGLYYWKLINDNFDLLFVGKIIVE